jgi:hypothetical protein
VTGCLFGLRYPNEFRAETRKSAISDKTGSDIDLPPPGCGGRDAFSFGYPEIIWRHPIYAWSAPTRPTRAVWRSPASPILRSVCAACACRCRASTGDSVAERSTSPAAIHKNRKIAYLRHRQSQKRNPAICRSEKNCHRELFSIQAFDKTRLTHHASHSISFSGAL